MDLAYRQYDGTVSIQLTVKELRIGVLALHDCFESFEVPANIQNEHLENMIVEHEYNDSLFLRFPPEYTRILTGFLAILMRRFGHVANFREEEKIYAFLERHYIDFLRRGYAALF